MDRIERLSRRVEAIEKFQEYNKTFPVYPVVPTGKRLIAASIFFASFVGLFITGLFLGWHWGWLVGIAVVGVGAAAVIAEGDI